MVPQSFDLPEVLERLTRLEQQNEKLQQQNHRLKRNGQSG
jgi:hypothetical protein